MRISLLSIWILLVSSMAIQAKDTAPPSNEVIKEKLQGFIDNGTVAGLIAVVADGKEVLSETVLGYANVETKKPMKDDAIFWIASMSKPVTGACVMILADQGKLSLDDPIVKHLPEMANLKTEDGKLAQITIRHLLTHTSGMAELEAGQAYTDATLADVAKKYANVKVEFAPGSKWQYSQTSINTAARIVEVISGTTFDHFVDEHVFKPLGMKDTTFYLTEEQLPRLVTSYETLKAGGFKEQPVRILAGKPPTFRGHFPAANGGLFSTAADYTKFAQMLLNGGELNGHHVLSAAAVKTMGTISTGDIKTGFTPGNGWGIGCCVVREPQGVTKSLSPGSFGHGGAYGTQAWIDPAKNRIYLLMVQRTNFDNGDASELRGAFQDTAQVLATK